MSLPKSISETTAQSSLQPLTEMQQKFAEKYVLYGNACRAAREAGYQSTGIGWKLLRHPGIQDAVQRILDQDGSILNATEILRELSTIALDSEQPITNRIRALELLGKRIGLWEAWQHRKGIPPQVMTDKELLVYGVSQGELDKPDSVEENPGIS